MLTGVSDAEGTSNSSLKSSFRKTKIRHKFHGIIGVIISYCINTTKYWLCTIFKDAITVLSYDKIFLSHYTMILSQTLSHRTATPILTYKSYSERGFSVIGCFPDSVQYRKNIAYLYHIDLYCNIF